VRFIRLVKNDMNVSPPKDEREEPMRPRAIALLFPFLSHCDAQNVMTFYAIPSLTSGG